MLEASIGQVHIWGKPMHLQWVTSMTHEGAELQKGDSSDVKR